MAMFLGFVLAAIAWRRWTFEISVAQFLDVVEDDSGASRNGWEDVSFVEGSANVAVIVELLMSECIVRGLGQVTGAGSRGAPSPPRLEV